MKRVHSAVTVAACLGAAMVTVQAQQRGGTSALRQWWVAKAKPGQYGTNNPHIKLANGARRGYLRMEITPARLRADLRTVRGVARPRAEADTLASFVVEDGRPGAVRG